MGSTISGVHVSEVRWGILSRPRAAWRSVPSAPRPFYMRETEASPLTTSSSSHRTTSSAVLPHPLGFSAMSTRGGGGGRRGGRGQQGGGRGGGSGRGGGRGRGQVAADLGGFREDTRGGPGRGHRGGSASSGAAQRGGGHAAQSQSPHPAAGPGPGPGRGGYSSAPRQVSSGPTPAEVEAMRRQVERKVVVDETQAQRCQGSSSSQAPAPRPAMQDKAPGPLAPAGRPLSIPAQSPAFFQAPAVRPAMQAKPPGQVAPAASSSERPLQMQGKAPDQMAPAGTLPPASSKAMVFPPRPGYGTVGRRCQVRANHVEVKLGDKDIYHYDVRTHGPYLCLGVLFLASAPCK